MSNLKRDEKRALDKEGIEQCGMVGRALAALDVQVDMIISSPLKRATQTASLVGNELSYEGKLQLEDALRPGATYADFRRLLEKYAKQESIMVVGHNPNLSEFLGAPSAKRDARRRGTEKRRRGQGGNGAQRGAAAVVPYSQGVARDLRRGD